MAAVKGNIDNKSIAEGLLSEIESRLGITCECVCTPKEVKGVPDVVKSYKTAISRKQPSRPTKMIAGEIQKKILDYGQGKGKDVEWLREHIQGYDPYWRNTPEILTDNTYDVVLNNYVLNTVPKETRELIIKDIERVLKPCGHAYFSVRDDSEKIAGEPHEDGVITVKGTFQKLFNSSELKELLKKYFDNVEIISKKAPLLAKVQKKCL